MRAGMASSMPFHIADADGKERVLPLQVLFRNGQRVVPAPGGRLSQLSVVQRRR